MIKPARVVLADDHDVFVEGLSVVLSLDGDIEVVAVASDSAGAMEALTGHRPDVLVLDAHMPGSDTADVVRGAKEQSPGTRVLVLSADTRLETMTRMLQAGADAFVSKEASGSQVARAIRKLADGQVEQVSFGTWVTEPKQDDHLALVMRSLSTRERQVLSLLAAGYSNRRIAAECFLSLNTVRTHVQNILVKLGVHSKLEAAAFAVRHGIVPGDRRPAAMG